MEHNKGLSYLCVGGAVPGCGGAADEVETGCFQGWDVVSLSQQGDAAVWLCFVFTQRVRNVECVNI